MQYKSKCCGMKSNNDHFIKASQSTEATPLEIMDSKTE